MANKGSGLDNFKSRYIPHTKKQQDDMLSSIGLKSLDELFKDIPENMKLTKRLDIPELMTENQLLGYMKEMASKNINTDDYSCFLGAGLYDHYIPSVVHHMLSRGEFYTAYTPYQPEISQGTLQAIFEYQTMICELTGMDVANASMYDGASAAAEAMLVACTAKRKSKIILSKTLNPEYRNVIKTYAKFNNIEVIEIKFKDGVTDLDELNKITSKQTAAVIVQYPNFFGAIEDLSEISDIAHKNGNYLIVATDPISLGVLKPPGEFGADMVLGEGQSLGNPLSFGGPHLGFFAVTKELMRRMPGRVVGQTTDLDGKRGFVLTMQTREQHIRREKATSNICTNQALNALTASIYLTLMGKKGIKEVAELCLQKSHYTYEKLIATGKFKPVFSAPFIKEFVVKINEKQSENMVETLNKQLLDEKIIGGYNLGKDFEEMENCILLAVTEKRTKSEIDRFVEKACLGVTSNER